MSFMNFELLVIDGKVCCGCLIFFCGVVEILVFMLVGIYGMVKGMLLCDIEDIGVQIIFGNIFYFWLCLGIEVIQCYGDLYDFMQWKGLIFIDFGGFQVFSLGVMCKIKEEGVIFVLLVDGVKVFMGLEEFMVV